jgi:hypothetical protein
MKSFYRVTIHKTTVEIGEIGRRWERTGRKAEDGSEEWGYTPSETGEKEVERVILSQIVEHEIDIPALQRLINRKPKEVKA